MMRVLHVLAPAATPGGLERMVITLAEGQAEAGHDVHVALVGEDPSAVGLGLFSRRGLSVHIVRIPERRYDLERVEIRRLCEEVRPNVVHSHGYRPDIVDAPAALPRGGAVVSTVHGFTGGGPRNRLYEWLQRRALRRRDAVAAVSHPLRSRLVSSGIAEDRVTVVPNACAPQALMPRDVAREQLGCPQEQVIVGWVGRLSREKGAHVLVSAMASLPDYVHAMVIGGGPEGRWLRSRAGATGVATRLTWCGAVPDASRYMAAFDVFALSSLTEGSPMVILEAMAAGVPIVATAVGGVADLVGESGALLVPREDPCALADAIRDVVANPGAAQERARIARARFDDHFRVPQWVAEYDRLYLRAMESAA